MELTYQKIGYTRIHTTMRINSEFFMKKYRFTFIISILISILFIRVDLFSLDLKKINLSWGDIEKYRMKNVKGIKGTRGEEIDEVSFIRGEIKRLSKLNLSEGELFEIINNENVSYIYTRIAALRLWIKNKGEEVIPELINLKKYYIEANKDKGKGIHPLPYELLVSHIERAIVDIAIRGKGCLERIDYMLSNFNNEDMLSEIGMLLPAHLNNCKDTKGLDDLLYRHYINDNDNIRGLIITKLAISEIPLAEKYIEIGLKDNNTYILAKVVGSCWYTYESRCVDKLREIVNDSSRDKSIRDLVKEFMDKIIQEKNHPLKDYKWIEENPIEF